MKTEEEVITEWFDDYVEDIYSFLFYYSGHAEVDDLVQEVFVKAWRKIHTRNLDLVFRDKQ
ncbi:RNA polymerase sigma factor [Aquibacillus kalidii]|uniref:RNA polymerase sigma factor n=1 Tax=Aquibacillus kalidii TaxID=2762597 RepID=UPI001646E633|nr:sigma factor [Aquibacillus kalidii]